MELTATQYLMTKLNASHFEDSRDEFTNTWEIVGGIIESYHQTKLKNSGVIGDVSARAFVNVYEDEEGRFIGDEEYTSYKSAFENRDDLSTYRETVEIVRNVC